MTIKLELTEERTQRELSEEEWEIGRASCRERV